MSLRSDRKSTLILGVDDNAMGLKVLRATLEAAGFSFIGTESGARCLELLWRIQPRIIILDVLMPDLDGFETCRRIRAQFPELGAPILFLTASNSADTLDAALAAGGDDFILKPFSPKMLLTRVESWSHKGRNGASRPARVQA